MEQNKTNIQYAVAFIGYVLLFAVLYLGFMRVDAYLRLKAFDDCGKLSRYETTDKNARVTYPVIDVYNQCLQDKGLK